MMIAIDWGTSSFRAYLLDGAGHVRERREAACGILAVAPGGFPAALAAQIAGWPDEEPIIMCGMVGSRQGWEEAPYADCPAGAAEIAAAMRRVNRPTGERPVWIAPGLACRDAAGTPEVMRGEETQILGVLAELPAGEAALCLPGTHTKWVRLCDGRIRDFATAMTGEVFAVLRRHSILGRLMPPASAEPSPDDAAFAAGLARSREPGGLLHHLFGVRSAGLFGAIPEEGLAAYLSGILIGREIADLAPSRGGPVHLVGAPALSALYARALEAAGHETRRLDPDCVARGLYLLSSSLPKEAGHA